MEADISSQAVGLASSADFSLMNLFIRADIVVKLVILTLIVCSIYSWAVIIEKVRLFKKIHKSTEEWLYFLETQCKICSNEDLKQI